MKHRHYWSNLLTRAWKSRSLMWLYGVRRAGKTFLSQQVEGIEYFDCELPRVRRRLEDPEAFWHSLRGKRVALDEVQRLPNPDGFDQATAVS